MDVGLIPRLAEPEALSVAVATMVEDEPDELGSPTLIPGILLLGSEDGNVDGKPEETPLGTPLPDDGRVVGILTGIAPVLVGKSVVSVD